MIFFKNKFFFKCRITNGNNQIISDDSRTINDDSRTMNDDTRSDARDYDDYNDFGMSDDDNAWRNERQSLISSSTPKKKSKPK